MWLQLQPRDLLLACELHANRLGMADEPLGLGQQCRLRPQARAFPAPVYSCTVMSFTKSFTLKPPRTRAMPPVGSV